ncbi:MAG: hypothetical protein H6552_01670 [Chitinophagales bacterium]|nr:hypothetical protein [Chitinophagales bacterium]
MYKTTLLILITLLLIACKSKQENWLQDYQKIKCKWFSLEEEVSKDTLKNTEKFSYQLTIINNEIETINKPIQNSISLLNEEKEKTIQKYQDEYRKITNAHSDIYGHISTPAYERKIEQNTKMSDIAVKIIDDKITTLQVTIEKNIAYQSGKAKQLKIQEEITAQNKIITEKYKPKFDELQYILDEQNEDFNYIKSELSDAEKQIFIRKRNAIRKSPCLNK